MKRATLAALALIAFVIIMTSVSLIDQEPVAVPADGSIDSLMDYSMYCSMVEQWEKEQSKGIELHRRTGWAPFLGRCE